MSKENIFLVEDEKSYLDLYNEALKSEFNCISFNNAQEALQEFAKYKPKTIILDLNLPQMNGIEFCSALFAKECQQSEVDIIFVSGDADLSTKLKAFDVGAADFLTKPFELKELRYKVRSSVSRKIREQALIQDVSDNQQLIYTTMEQASQYNNVMSFFKNLSHCNNTSDVSEVFFDTMSKFGLICSLSVRIPDLQYFRSDQQEMSPIERDVFDLLKDKGRIFPFTNRLIINDDHVSFIIKNPPQDDHTLGQVRDYVAAIVEGLESKILEIFSQKGMNSAISDLADNIAHLKSGIHEHNKVINAVMSNMITEIASSFHSLEMTEPQEQFLNTLIENSTEQLSHAESHLVDIMTGLERIKSNMETVQHAVISHEKSQPTSDLELF
ncbi:MAG: response regulator transcription factor [Gammaproteobacteria bacterium]|nr:response regulator transcription factor [Gammaproteobacteria bacterium]